MGKIYSYIRPLLSILYIRSLLSKSIANTKINLIHRYFIQEAAAIVPDGSKPIIAIQGIELLLYYSLFGQISLDLRRRIGVSGRLVMIRSLTVGYSARAIFERTDIVNYLITSKWANINKEVVGPVGYRSQSFNYFFSDLLDIWRSFRVWRRLDKTADISKLSIHQIIVGDLIIDSYLRFRPSPRFIAKDVFVWQILWQAHRDIRRAKAFFSKVKPAIYLSSYSTYIQHGIAVRAALAEGVPVYVFGSSDVFGKKLSVDDVYHLSGPETSRYRTLFENLDQKEKRLSEAEKQLSQRLSGGIDHATSYMKVSAYATTDEAIPEVSGAVVVFLHDFCDSPHIFDDLIFIDFWDWIIYTIDILSKTGIRFFIKPHPNQIPESAEAVVLLMAMYPKLNMISPKITNTQLVNAGMICGVTTYGTVAYELAFMGVPTIACARHLYHSFDFCRTAKSVSEYKSFLQTPEYKPLPESEMRSQALAFLYMDKIYSGDNLVALRKQLAAIITAIEDKEDGGAALLEEIKNLQELPFYKSLIDTLVNEIGKRNGQ